MESSLSRNTYLRKRAFHKSHVKSWLIFLEKDGFIRCHLQGCKFIAQSIDEMKGHYGYCNGTNSSTPFECPYCGGQTNTIDLLNSHLQQAHIMSDMVITAVPTKLNDISDNEKVPELDENVANMKKLLIEWRSNGYVRCPFSCNTIQKKLFSLIQHLTSCEKGSSLFKAICICGFNSNNSIAFLHHTQTCDAVIFHVKNVNTYNFDLQVTEDIVNTWKNLLEDKGFVCCNRCSHLTFSVKSTAHHYSACLKELSTVEQFACPFCIGWTKSFESLLNHVFLSHSVLSEYFTVSRPKPYKPLIEVEKMFFKAKDSFICQFCQMHFKILSDIQNHKKEDHLKLSDSQTVLILWQSSNLKDCLFCPKYWCNHSCLTLLEMVEHFETCFEEAGLNACVAVKIVEENREKPNVETENKRRKFESIQAEKAVNPATNVTKKHSKAEIKSKNLGVKSSETTKEYEDSFGECYSSKAQSVSKTKNHAVNEISKKELVEEEKSGGDVRNSTKEKSDKRSCVEAGNGVRNIEEEKSLSGFKANKDLTLGGIECEVEEKFRKGNFEKESKIDHEVSQLRKEISVKKIEAVVKNITTGNKVGSNNCQKKYEPKKKQCVNDIALKDGRKQSEMESTSEFHEDDQILVVGQNQLSPEVNRIDNEDKLSTTDLTEEKSLGRPSKERNLENRLPFKTSKVEVISDIIEVIQPDEIETCHNRPEESKKQQVKNLKVHTDNVICKTVSTAKSASEINEKKCIEVEKECEISLVKDSKENDGRLKEIVELTAEESEELQIKPKVRISKQIKTYKAQTKKNDKSRTEKAMESLFSKTMERKFLGVDAENKNEVDLSSENGESSDGFKKPMKPMAEECTGSETVKGKESKNYQGLSKINKEQQLESFEVQNRNEMCKSEKSVESMILETSEGKSVEVEIEVDLIKNNNDSRIFEASTEQVAEEFTVNEISAEESKKHQERPKLSKEQPVESFETLTKNKAHGSESSVESLDLNINAGNYFETESLKENEFDKIQENEIRAGRLEVEIEQVAKECILSEESAEESLNYRGRPKSKNEQQIESFKVQASSEICGAETAEKGMLLEISEKEFRKVEMENTSEVCTIEESFKSLRSLKAKVGQIEEKCEEDDKNKVGETKKRCRPKLYENEKTESFKAQSSQEICESENAKDREPEDASETELNDLKIKNIVEIAEETTKSCNKLKGKVDEVSEEYEVNEVSKAGESEVRLGKPKLNQDQQAESFNFQISNEMCKSESKEEKTPRQISEKQCYEVEIENLNKVGNIEGTVKNCENLKENVVHIAEEGKRDEEIKAVETKKHQGRPRLSKEEKVESFKVQISHTICEAKSAEERTPIERCVKECFDKIESTKEVCTIEETVKSFRSLESKTGKVIKESKRDGEGKADETKKRRGRPKLNKEEKVGSFKALTENGTYKTESTNARVPSEVREKECSEVESENINEVSPIKETVKNVGNVEENIEKVAIKVDITKKRRGRPKLNKEKVGSFKALTDDKTPNEMSRLQCDEVEIENMNEVSIMEETSISGENSKEIIGQVAEKCNKDKEIKTNETKKCRGRPKLCKEEKVENFKALTENKIYKAKSTDERTQSEISEKQCHEVEIENTNKLGTIKETVKNVENLKENIEMVVKERKTDGEINANETKKRRGRPKLNKDKTVGSLKAPIENEFCEIESTDGRTQNEMSKMQCHEVENESKNEVSMMEGALISGENLRKTLGQVEEKCEKDEGIEVVESKKRRGRPRLSKEEKVDCPSGQINNVICGAKNTEERTSMKMYEKQCSEAVFGSTCEVSTMEGTTMRNGNLKAKIGQIAEEGERDKEIKVAETKKRRGRPRLSRELSVENLLSMEVGERKCIDAELDSEKRASIIEGKKRTGERCEAELELVAEEYKVNEKIKGAENKKHRGRPKLNKEKQAESLKVQTKSETSLTVSGVESTKVEVSKKKCSGVEISDANERISKESCSNSIGKLEPVEDERNSNVDNKAEGKKRRGRPKINQEPLLGSSKALMKTEKCETNRTVERTNLEMRKRKCSEADVVIENKKSRGKFKANSEQVAKESKVNEVSKTVLVERGKRGPEKLKMKKNVHNVTKKLEVENRTLQVREDLTKGNIEAIRGEMESDCSEGGSRSSKQTYVRKNQSNKDFEPKCTKKFAKPISENLNVSSMIECEVRNNKSNKRSGTVEDQSSNQFNRQKSVQSSKFSRTCSSSTEDDEDYDQSDLTEDVHPSEVLELSKMSDNGSTEPLKYQEKQQCDDSVLIPDLTVKCMVCNIEMLTEHYNNVHKDSHYNLCWIKGEEPIDIHNVDKNLQLLKQYTKKNKSHGKKNKFICSKCGQSEFKAINYLNHFRRCSDEILSGVPNKRRKIKNSETSLPKNKNDLTNTQETEEMGENELSEDLGRKRRKEAVSDSNICDDQESKYSPSDIVKCGACETEMEYQVYIKTHVEKHYKLCWIEGEPPLDFFDDKVCMNILTKYQSKFIRLRKQNIIKVYHCFKCNGIQKSAIGHLSHLRACAVKEEDKHKIMVSCEICHRFLMRSSVKSHMSQFHSDPQNSPEIPRDFSQTKGVRSAALKARKVINKMKESLGMSKNDEEDNKEDEDFSINSDDEENDENSHESRLNVKFERSPTESFVIFRKPTHRLSVNIIKSWQVAIAKGLPGNCIIPGCHFESTCFDTLKQHYLKCPLAVLKAYSCSRCNFKADKAEDVENHVVENHGCLAKSFDDYLYGSLGNHLTKFIPNVEDSRLIDTHIERLNFSFLWTSNFFASKLAKECNFEFAKKTSEFYFLDDDQASRYLPSCRKSMSVHSKSGENSHFDLFQVEAENGFYKIFTGSPIWSMAWAPTSVFEAKQYLAISTHHSMNSVYMKKHNVSHKGLIQIWEFSSLKNLDDEVCDPKLFLSIAHEFGTAWCMEWCPGEFVSETTVGLMSVAFSSGIVAIYSIPTQKKLPKVSVSYPVFKVKPVMVLKLQQEENVQCMRISWQRVKPHNIFTAGYVNGVVGVWDLTSSSPLLKQGDVLFPFYVFQPHFCSITGLQLGALGEDRFIATCATDRIGIFCWDLKDTSSPVYHTCRTKARNNPLMTDLIWPNNWFSVISSSDDAFSLGTAVQINSLREFNYAVEQLLPQTAVNFSVSYSEWTGSVAASSGDGNVLFIAPGQLFRIYDQKHVNIKKIIMSTILIDKSSSSPIVPRKNRKRTADSESLNYAEAVEKYSVQFKPVMEPYKIGNNLNSRIIPSNELNLYPLHCVNKVAWNPNCQSFLWLAMGYQNGFLCLMRKDIVRKRTLEHLYSTLK